MFQGVLYLLDEKKFGAETSTKSAMVTKNLLRTVEVCTDGARVGMSNQNGCPAGVCRVLRYLPFATRPV